MKRDIKDMFYISAIGMGIVLFIGIVSVLSLGAISVILGIIL